MSAYQAVCFPIYGIDKVRRSEHFIYDRAKLGYLNALEKLNFIYCSYGKGLISYTREIASRTEQYLQLRSAVNRTNVLRVSCGHESAATRPGNRS